MNPAIVLNLIADLYAQVTSLAEENARLRERLSAVDDVREVHVEDEPAPATA